MESMFREYPLEGARKGTHSLIIEIYTDDEDIGPIKVEDGLAYGQVTTGHARVTWKDNDVSRSFNPAKMSIKTLVPSREIEEYVRACIQAATMDYLKEHAGLTEDDLIDNGE